MKILTAASSVLELAGFGFIVVAAFLLSLTLGFFVLGVILVFVGYSLDPTDRRSPVEDDA